MPHASLILIFTLIALGFVDLLAGVRVFRLKFTKKSINDLVLHIILSIEATYALKAVKTGERLLPVWKSVQDKHAIGALEGILFLWPTLIIIYVLVALNKEYVLRKGTINATSVALALEKIDCGLLFTQKDGTPVLINSKMKEVSKLLFGRDITYQKGFWELLENYEESEFCTYAQKENFAGESIYLTNGQAIRLTRFSLSDGRKEYYEIVAEDISVIYRRSLELEHKNEELEELEKRLAKTYENIAAIQQERELLAYKYRIHDELGSSILKGYRLLDDNDITKEERESFISDWQKTLNSYMSNSIQGEATGETVYMDIIKTAMALGCRLIIKGDRPRRSEVLSMAIREAVYNAIKHAGADTVFVEGRLEGEVYFFKIYDQKTKDSTVDASGKNIKSDMNSQVSESVREGGGLGNMRRSIEAVGGSLKVEYEDGVVLYITLPVAEE